MNTHEFLHETTPMFLYAQIQLHREAQGLVERRDNESSSNQKHTIDYFF